MYIKLNKPFLLMMCVSSNGGRVNNDTPYVTIQDRDTGKYYNGLFFDEGETRISLRFSQSGVYVYNFTPNYIPRTCFDVRCCSVNYPESNTTYTLYVYNDESLPAYSWKRGDAFVITHSNIFGDIAKCIIQRNSDGKYYDGAEWVGEETRLSMILSSNNALWMFNFTPEDSGKYILHTIDEKNEYVYMLDVSDTANDTGVPIMVGSGSLQLDDGSDTVVITSKGFPIAGAHVLAYKHNSATPENEKGILVKKAVTGIDGKWNMLLPAGTYDFIFEKDKYASYVLVGKTIGGM